MSKRHSNLIRKQYLVSESNIEKLNRVAAERGTSAAEIVRQAIDAYDTTVIGCQDSPDLMGLGPKLGAVLNQYAATSTGFYLYYPKRSQVLPKLRAFIDNIREVRQYSPVSEQHDIKKIFFD